MKLTIAHVFGEATSDRELGWQGHIEFLDWLDEEHLVYCETSGKLACLHIESQAFVWQHDIELEYGKFSLCRNRRILAVLSATKPDGRLIVIDCDTGNLLADFNNQDIAKIIGVDIAHPANIALTPVHAKLLITCFSETFGANGYIIDNQYKVLLRQFETDMYVQRLSVSPDESRITMLADKYTVSVYDLTSEKWIFLQGERIYERQNSVEGDSSPGINHVFHDGEDILIFNSDGGFAGMAFVHSIKDKDAHSFMVPNAHNELDVDFENRRIAITGTGLDLLIVSFEGDELGFHPKANLQRNQCIKFSPSHQRIAVGSWDNTISTYEISDEYDPEAPTYYDKFTIDASHLLTESDESDAD